MTDRIKIEPMQKGNFNAAFIKALNSEIEKTAHYLGNRIVALAVSKLDQSKHNNTGQTRKSISYNTSQASILTRRTLQVGAGARHAIFVHEGSVPHRPPLAPILKWVKQKFPGLRHNEYRANKRAWQVVRKIEKHGTKATPFLREAIEDIQTVIPRELDKAVTNAISQVQK
jgi:hypothetical protein